MVSERPTPWHSQKQGNRIRPSLLCHSIVHNINSAYVSIGDVDANAGNELVSELKGYVLSYCFLLDIFIKMIPLCSAAQFVKCDVRSWDDQVALFDAAVKHSPHHSCDVVIANAGIVGADDLFKLEGGLRAS